MVQTVDGGLCSRCERSGTPTTGQHPGRWTMGRSTPVGHRPIGTRGVTSEQVEGVMSDKAEPHHVNMDVEFTTEEMVALRRLADQVGVDIKVFLNEALRLGLQVYTATGQTMTKMKLTNQTKVKGKVH
jgi:hypothetical protein